jgi:hypothetical protein
MAFPMADDKYGDNRPAPKEEPPVGAKSEAPAPKEEAPPETRPNGDPWPVPGDNYVFDGVSPGPPWLAGAIGNDGGHVVLHFQTKEGYNAGPAREGDKVYCDASGALKIITKKELEGIAGMTPPPAP